MRRAGLVLALVLLCGCSRDPKAEKMAALDRALAAGLLTRQEYEVRKAAVMETPAAALPAPAARPSAPPVAATPAPVATSQPTTPAGSAPPTPATSSRVAAPPPAAMAPTPTQTAAPVAEQHVLPKKKATAIVPVPPEPKAPPPPPPKPVEEAAPEPAPLPGCEDTPIAPGKEKGQQERFFPMPLARVRSAAVTSLEFLDFTIHKRSARDIEASRKHHLGLIGSGGERIVLHFEEARRGGQGGTRVTGETKKTILLRAGQKSWTNAVLSQMACVLRK